MVSKSLTIFICVALLEAASAQTTIPTTPTPPSFVNCPDDIVKYVQSDTDTATVSWMEPTVIPPGFIIDRSHGRPPQNLKIGKYRIVYSVDSEDLFCEFDVEVKDSTKPRFANCPNVKIAEVTVDGPEDGAVVTFDVEPLDNAGDSNLVVTTTPKQSGDMFSYGITRVEVNATDPSGNRGQCIFSVYVRAPLKTCSSDAEQNLCAPPILVTQVTHDMIEMTWPTESDNIVQGSYSISYWPDGQRDKARNSTNAFKNWDYGRFPYISRQKFEGLDSATVYNFDISKTYSNGTIQEVGFLMQRTRPSPVRMIQFSSISATRAKVYWTSEIESVDQFHVSYTDDELVKYDVGYFPKHVSETVLDNLRPSQVNLDSRITVTVEAISGSGSQRSTSSSTPGSPFKIAQILNDVEIKNYTENSVGITWKATQFRIDPEPVMIYLFNDKYEQINFTLVLASNQNSDSRHDLQFNQRFPEYEFTGLRPKTTYIITTIFNGDYLEPAFKQSLEQKTRPRRIENLHAKEIFDNSFIVTWDRAKNSYPDKYQIFISPQDDSDLDRPVIVTQNEYEFQGLQNDTEYFVTVISVEDDMESIAVSVTITTGESVPGTEEQPEVPFLTIVIGVVLGVVILFLIIIIFFLLCLIPCDTIPPPPQTPIKPANLQANGTQNPSYETNDVIDAFSNGHVQANGTNQTHKKTPPLILTPKRPAGRESTAGLIAAMEAGVPEVSQKPESNTGEIPGQEVYVNLFGLKMKPRQSLFRKTVKVEKPAEDGIPGHFNQRKMSTVDDQIYDNPAPEEQHHNDDFDDDFDEDEF